MSSPCFADPETAIILIVGAKKNSELNLDVALQPGRKSEIQKALERDNPGGFNVVLFSPTLAELKDLKFPSHIRRANFIIQAHAAPSQANQNEFRIGLSDYERRESWKDVVSALDRGTNLHADFSLFTCWAGAVEKDTLRTGSIFGSTAADVQGTTGDHLDFFDAIVEGELRFPSSAQAAYSIYEKYIGSARRKRNAAEPVHRGMPVPFWVSVRQADGTFETTGVPVAADSEDINTQRYQSRTRLTRALAFHQIRSAAKCLGRMSDVALGTAGAENH